MSEHALVTRPMIRAALQQSIERATARRLGAVPLRRDPELEAMDDRLLELWENASLRAELVLAHRRSVA